MAFIRSLANEIAELICEYVGTHTLLVSILPFPEQGVSERGSRVEKTLHLTGVFYESLNLYIEILQDKKKYILAEAIEFQNGIQYCFNLTKIASIATGAKVGDVTFIRKIIH